MDLIKTLKTTGLSTNQAKVYIACLQLGVASVLNIAKNADLKRPSVYLILDDLENLGLVSKTKKTNKTLYKAEKPERILTEIQKTEHVIKAALPSLNAIYNIDPEKPNIKIAEGSNGVRSVYKGIFTYLTTNPNEEFLIFGSLKDAKQYFEKEVLDYFFEKVGKTQNIIREIGNDDHETRKYYREAHKINPNHDIRLIKNEGRFTKTDNMIYGNTLVVLSTKEQLFATIIESVSIVETYKTLFNMAWKTGKRI